MKLSKEQAKHLDSLRWLFGEGPRCSGRTYLLACVLIEQAIETDRDIKLLDHHWVLHGHPNNNEHMWNEIIKVFGSYPELYENYNLDFMRMNHTFSIKPNIDSTKPVWETPWSFE